MLVRVRVRLFSFSKSCQVSPLADVQNFILGLRPAKTVKKKINRLFTDLGWSAKEKNVPSSMALGQTTGTVFPVRSFQSINYLICVPIQ